MLREKTLIILKISPETLQVLIQRKNYHRATCMPNLKQIKTKFFCNYICLHFGEFHIWATKLKYSSISLFLGWAERIWRKNFTHTKKIEKMNCYDLINRFVWSVSDPWICSVKSLSTKLRLVKFLDDKHRSVQNIGIQIHSRPDWNLKTAMHWAHTKKTFLLWSCYFLLKLDWIFPGGYNFFGNIWKFNSQSPGWFALPYKLWIYLLTL